nr:hypothetical transcript [Hymenolepis microstoma]
MLEWCSPRSGNQKAGFQGAATSMEEKLKTLTQEEKATQTMTTDSAKTVNKGNCRRFFTSTFAERNKREVERHFLEMVGELSDPSTLKPGGRQL